MLLDVDLEDVVDFTVFTDAGNLEKVSECTEKVAKENAISLSDASKYLAQLSRVIKRTLTAHPNFILSDEQKFKVEEAIFMPGGMKPDDPTLLEIANQNKVSAQDAMIVLLAMKASVSSPELPNPAKDNPRVQNIIASRERAQGQGHGGQGR